MSITGGTAPGAARAGAGNGDQNRNPTRPTTTPTRADATIREATTSSLAKVAASPCALPSKTPTSASASTSTSTSTSTSKPAPQSGSIPSNNPNAHTEHQPEMEKLAIEEGQWTRDAARRFETKGYSQYMDPCQEAADRSLNCQKRNPGDRDMCLAYFKAYRDCKKAWMDERKRARRERGNNWW